MPTHGPTEASEREFDIVLLGATGFTGGLTADYLARTMPADGRWALAGRNQGKLETVRDRLTGIDAKLAGLPLLKADSSDPASLADIASRARVVITTVGPYVEHGEPLVAACAAHGTDYVDLTGEPEFIDRMYVEHHAEAERTGARIVHACGFDSIPHDLGALFTVKQLPEGQPLKVRGVVRANGMVSGGTFASALTTFARASKMRAASAARRRVEPRPAGGRRVHSSAKRPHFDKEAGMWLIPLPTIDPFVVRRSAAALERYGPEFSYAHYAGVKRLPVAVGGMGAVGALMVGAQAAAAAPVPHASAPAGRGPERGATRAALVLGQVRRRGRRPAGGDRGERRGPGLHRDRGDAVRVRDVAGLRRQPALGGPGHDRGRDGGQPHRPAHQGRHRLHGATGRLSRQVVRSATKHHPVGGRLG